MKEITERDEYGRPVVTKAPGAAAARLYFDLTEYLADIAGTLDSFTITATGLVKSQEASENGVVSVVVTGGQLRTDYLVQLDFVASGYPDSRGIVVKVRPR